MHNRPTLKHELQTPSFAFSLLGVLSLVASVVFERRRLEVPAFCLLGAAGVGGVAIALWTVVERKNEEWGWRGLYRALRHPDRYFWEGFWMHVPQFLMAIAIALVWRRRGMRESGG
ncbi:hypothetical protein LCGC14_0445890 [marine sediment metagenome]|uniref:Uncharacterized protein n=1 Tax=marine sediment metagenome TaxID=412755 RepID=A0A0F9T293_9ZZZZ